MKRGQFHTMKIIWAFVCLLFVFFTHIVQFEVEAAGVAHRVSVRVPPPQRRRCGLTVRARRPRTPGCGLHNDRGWESHDHVLIQSTDTFTAPTG